MQRNKMNTCWIFHTSRKMDILFASSTPCRLIPVPHANLDITVQMLASKNK